MSLKISKDLIADEVRGAVTHLDQYPIQIIKVPHFNPSNFDEKVVDKNYHKDGKVSEGEQKMEKDSSLKVSIEFKNDNR